MKEAKYMKCYNGLLLYLSADKSLTYIYEKKITFSVCQSVGWSLENVKSEYEISLISTFTSNCLHFMFNQRQKVL